MNCDSPSNVPVWDECGSIDENYWVDNQTDGSEEPVLVSSQKVESPIFASFDIPSESSKESCSTQMEMLQTSFVDHSYIVPSPACSGSDSVPPASQCLSEDDADDPVLTIHVLPNEENHTDPNVDTTLDTTPPSPRSARLLASALTSIVSCNENAMDVPCTYALNGSPIINTTYRHASSTHQPLSFWTKLLKKHALEAKFPVLSSNLKSLLAYINTPMLNTSVAPEVFFAYLLHREGMIPPMYSQYYSHCLNKTDKRIPYRHRSTLISLIAANDEQTKQLQEPEPSTVCAICYPGCTCTISTEICQCEGTCPCIWFIQIVFDSIMYKNLRNNGYTPFIALYGAANALKNDICHLTSDLPPLETTKGHIERVYTTIDKAEMYISEALSTIYPMFVKNRQKRLLKLAKIKNTV